MAIYAVKWNPFHQQVFISCSADWTVRVWHESHQSPVLTFELGTSVSNVSWAPYSSTTFAAVTSDGKVYVFDLSVSKHDPIGHQRVVKKGKLSQLCFNPTDPVLLVGDDRGSIMSLKLSPNLRRMSADTLNELDPVVEVAEQL